MSNAARYADQSDPDRNVQFRRRWSESPTALPRYQRLTENLHAQGPRPLAELLAEVGAANDCMADILKRLERYSWATPALIKALGGDRFPSRPLRVVPR